MFAGWQHVVAVRSQRPLPQQLVDKLVDAAVELDGLKFKNRFTSELVGDPIKLNNRRQVTGAYFSNVNPTITSAPKMLAASNEVLDLIGLEKNIVNSQVFADVFSGNALTRGMEPHAMCFGSRSKFAAPPVNLVNYFIICLSKLILSTLIILKQSQCIVDLSI